MQPVNDDMDNLFRRAAEGYPLHTHGANFDKVRQQLDAETPVPEKERKSHRYLWLLLLLLIPFPFLYQHYQASMPSGKDKQYTITAKQEIHNQDNSSTDNASPHKNNGSETTGVPGVTGEEIEKEKNNTTTQPVTETPAINTTKEVSNTIPGKAVATVEKQNTVNNIRRRQNRDRNHSAGALQPTKNSKQQQGNENFFSSAYTKKRTAKSDLLNKRKDAEDSSGKLLNAVPAVATQTPNVATNNTVNDSPLKIKVAKQITDSTTLTKVNKQNKEDTVTSKNTAIKNKNRKKPGVYIGIAMGPDYSTVKSNKSNGPGYNIGFVAGYQTGRHLAFETGILWNYKKYYSDGKHVSLDKLALQSHTEVIYLNGTCGIIEIPVSIRYHFNSKGKSNWYIGSGASSYIMKKEDYYYKYKRYNMEYYSEKEYTNSSDNWFSVLQFNIGYQLNMQKAGSLRIEPYVKLPVHGIGIGNLPLSGGGINIGYFLPIH